MRRLVGVLRDDDNAAALAPQPTLHEIPALLAQLAAAGLNADLEVTGTQREVPAGVELSAYRIVQEALTNTLKHSGAGHATVRLAWSQAPSTSRSATTARPQASPFPGRCAPTAAARDLSACASESSCSAASWKPGPVRAAVTGSPRAFH